MKLFNARHIFAEINMHLLPVPEISEHVKPFHLIKIFSFVFFSEVCHYPFYVGFFPILWIPYSVPMDKEAIILKMSAHCFKERIVFLYWNHIYCPVPNNKVKPQMCS